MITKKVIRDTNRFNIETIVTGDSEQEVNTELAKMELTWPPVYFPMAYDAIKSVDNPGKWIGQFTRAHSCD